MLSIRAFGRREVSTVKTLYTDTLYNSKNLYNVICICTNVPFSLNLGTLQQKFSLTSNNLGTNSVLVKRVDCIYLIRILQNSLKRANYLKR